MGRKVRGVFSGLGACALLVAFLAGVPVCLVRLVGNPLPAGPPAWSSVVAVIDSGTVPPGVLVRVVAIVVWIWWSQVAISFLAEIVAVRRGRATRPLPLRALGMQPLVVRLVAVAVTTTGAFAALAPPALAATPSFADITVPIGSRESTHDGVAESAPILFPATAPAGTGAQSAGPAPAPRTDVISRLSGIRRQAHEAPPTEPALRPPVTAPSAGAPPPGEPQGDTSPDAPPPGAPSPVATPPGAVGWIVVKPGDSLWHLAERHLGDALRWEDIYELNSGPLPGGGALRDPNLIHPGWRLRLPQADSPVPAGATGARR